MISSSAWLGAATPDGRCPAASAVTSSRKKELGVLHRAWAARAVGVPQRAGDPGVAEVAVAHEVVALLGLEDAAPGVDAIHAFPMVVFSEV